MDSGAMVDWFEARPINQAMSDNMSQCVRARLDTIGIESIGSGANVRLLDYACGSGFLSRIFAPYVSKIEAIDASPSMVERYNARIAELGPAHKSTRVVVGNLLSNPASPCTLEGDRYHGFDLITVGAALHHFANAATAVERLAERLRAGGIVYIQDMFDDGHVGSESDRPRGFTFDELRSVMSSAGLVDFRFEVLPDAFEMELPNAGVVKIRCFIARAMKRKQ